MVVISFCVANWNHLLYYNYVLPFMATYQVNELWQTRNSKFVSPIDQMELQLNTLFAGFQKSQLMLCILPFKANHSYQWLQEKGQGWPFLKNCTNMLILKSECLHCRQIQIKQLNLDTWKPCVSVCSKLPTYHPAW